MSHHLPATTIVDAFVTVSNSDELTTKVLRHFLDKHTTEFVKLVQGEKKEFTFANDEHVGIYMEIPLGSQDSKIPPIKTLREIFGMGLAEAKQFVDHMGRNGYDGHEKVKAPTWVVPYFKAVEGIKEFERQQPWLRGRIKIKKNGG